MLHDSIQVQSDRVQAVKVLSATSKQPWRKPLITFVPMGITASTSGTNIDSEGGELQSG